MSHSTRDLLSRLGEVCFLEVTKAQAEKKGIIGDLQTAMCKRMALPWPRFQPAQLRVGYLFLLGVFFHYFTLLRSFSELETRPEMSSDQLVADVARDAATAFSISPNYP